MLHVTNGDSVAGSLRLSGVPGVVVVWADVLHEGPVPGRLTDAQMRELRARFHAAEGWASYEDDLRRLEAWDRQLEAFSGHDETVLWFEHDLYDQLLLIRHLAWFARRRDATGLTLICIADHPEVTPFHGLGQLSPAQLAALAPQRQPITDDQFRAAAAAWGAFTADDPRQLEDVLAGDLTALPHLGPALRRLLEQYPWTTDGLSRTQRQILTAIGGQGASFDELFRRDQQMEQAPFMGDTTLWRHVEQLAEGARPLVAIDPAGATPDRAPMQDTARRRLGAVQLRLTDAAAAVLAGEADHVQLNGIDRWIGGVHLRGSESPFRWDPVTQRLAVLA
jgi:hypothetical protein